MIARRYAKALVNLAEKEKDLDNAGKNLTAITEVYKEEADLRHWVAEESVALAEKELKQDMNQNQQNKLVKKYMEELSQTEGAA